MNALQWINEFLEELSFKSAYHWAPKDDSFEILVYMHMYYKAEHQRTDAFELWCLWCLDSKPVNTRGHQPWIFTARNDAKAEALWPPDAKELTHWERLWCWERLKAKGERGSRGWDGWTASPSQWTWIWANSRRWWRTGMPGMLQSWGNKETSISEQPNINNIIKCHYRHAYISLYMYTFINMHIERTNIC